MGGIPGYEAYSVIINAIQPEEPYSEVYGVEDTKLIKLLNEFKDNAFVRFVLDDRYLTSLLKALRHDLTGVLSRFPSYERLSARDTLADVGTVLAKQVSSGKSKRATADLTPAPTLVAPISGKVSIEGDMLVIGYEEKEEADYTIPFTANIRVANGSRVKAGEQLTDGNANPQDILRIRGREAVQRYLVDEIQRVYRSQGVTINEKHIEIMVRRMLQKVRVDSPGDTELLPGDLVDRFRFEDINARVVAPGRRLYRPRSVGMAGRKVAIYAG